VTDDGVQRLTFAPDALADLTLRSRSFQHRVRAALVSRALGTHPIRGVHVETRASGVGGAGPQA
jgi:hypothetical protein